MNQNFYINYRQVYEDELSETIKDSLEKPRLFSDLSHQERMMFEELVDIGYRRALQDALDPEVLQDVSSLAAELGSQLNSFANLVNSYVAVEESED